MEKVVGKAKDALVKLGDWSRVIDFTVVNLDDFDVVLGQNSLRVAKAVPVTCAEIMVIFLGEDVIVVPMVRNNLEPVSFTDLSMPGARKHSVKKTVRQGFQGETKYAQTLDDIGLKKEIEQRIVKLETMVKVASSSTINREAQCNGGCNGHDGDIGHLNFGELFGGNRDNTWEPEGIG